MLVKHEPKLKTEQVEKLYSEKDGVAVKYVCSSELSRDNEVEDIFYRETPHPKFGNRYFGLVMLNNKLYIRNADDIENKTFGCVESDDGFLEYSQCRWHFKKFENGNMIDGGRAYIKHSGKVSVFVVKNGEMIPQ